MNAQTTTAEREAFDSVRREVGLNPVGLTLEAGKRYRTRDGRITEALRREYEWFIGRVPRSAPEGSIPMVERTWNQNGRLVGASHPCDLDLASVYDATEEAEAGIRVLPHIRPGRRYRMRNGEATGPIMASSALSEYPWKAPIGGGFGSWSSAGLWSSSGNVSQFDLIAEIGDEANATGPEPLKLASGRYYVTRGGDIVGPARAHTSTNRYSWNAINHRTGIWQNYEPHGSCCGEVGYDIIREATDVEAESVTTGANGVDQETGKPTAAPPSIASIAAALTDHCTEKRELPLRRGSRVKMRNGATVGPLATVKGLAGIKFVAKYAGKLVAWNEAGECNRHLSGDLGLTNFLDIIEVVESDQQPVTVNVYETRSGQVRVGAYANREAADAAAAKPGGDGERIACIDAFTVRRGAGIDGKSWHCKCGTGVA